MNPTYTYGKRSHGASQDQRPSVIRKQASSNSSGFLVCSCPQNLNSVQACFCFAEMKGHARDARCFWACYRQHFAFTRATFARICNNPYLGPLNPALDDVIGALGGELRSSIITVALLTCHGRPSCLSSILSLTASIDSIHMLHSRSVGKMPCLLPQDVPEDSTTSKKPARNIGKRTSIIFAPLPPPEITQPDKFPELRDQPEPVAAV